MAKQKVALSVLLWDDWTAGSRAHLRVDLWESLAMPTAAQWDLKKVQTTVPRMAPRRADQTVPS
jgi:hypothetical protein